MCESDKMEGKSMSYTNKSETPRKNAPKGKAALASAVAAILLLASSGLPIQSALADVYSDRDAASTAADEAKASYDEAVNQYEAALAEAEGNKADVENLQADIEAKKPEVAEAARALYTQDGDRLTTFIEIVVSGDNLADILSRLDSANRIYEYHAGVLSRASADKRALEDKQRQLDESLAVADSKKAKLSDALDEALEAYEEAQSAVEAQEAAAAASSSSSGYAESSYVASGVIGDVQADVTVSVSELRFMGVVYSNGWRFTWYSESVLPGPGLDIPGRHHDSGMVCDGDGYICVASSDLPRGTVVPTPLGRAGKVYDSGCASGTIDLYLV